MGIEPTGRAVHARPNGFEDRGHHQVCKHFRSTIASKSLCNMALRLTLGYRLSGEISPLWVRCPCVLALRCRFPVPYPYAVPLLYPKNVECSTMPRRPVRIVSWHKARGCWRKKYSGKTYYLATGGVCKGETDQQGYEIALGEWFDIKRQIGNGDTDEKPVPAFATFGEPLRLPTKHLLVMATDYSALPDELPNAGIVAMPDALLRAVVDAYLATVKRFLEWCYRNELVELLPRNLDRTFAQIELPKPEPHPFTAAEVRQLFKIKVGNRSPGAQSDPTPEEIRVRCEAIQRTWSEKERRKRDGYGDGGEVEVRRLSDPWPEYR